MVEFCREVAEECEWADDKSKRKLGRAITKGVAAGEAEDTKETSTNAGIASGEEGRSGGSGLVSTRCSPVALKGPSILHPFLKRFPISRVSIFR
jgi:hypothetical protein